MDSILSNDKSECFICGSHQWIEKHHVFYGRGKRKVSEQNGFTVYLCHRHHNEPPDGVHFNIGVDDELKQTCQAAYEKTHSREQFTNIIGRNYL